METSAKYINIGIIAHVDAGKTTVTEQMLYKSGAIKNAGKVDRGTSQTDWLDVEKERGISVRSASASFTYNNINVNLIDTPGHIDFASEVERVFPAMDCAILVISAVEGIQGHTETLWSSLRNNKIPCICFINKCDRAGSNVESVIKEIKNELAPSTISINNITGEGTNGVITNGYKEFKNHLYRESIIETIAENDDDLLEKYLEFGKVDNGQVFRSIRKQIADSIITPIIIGSAKFDQGIDHLMDFITNYFTIPECDPNASVKGIVYKVDHDQSKVRYASVRLFDGTLKNRDLIVIGGKERKITHIKKQSGIELIDTGILTAGDTGVIYGIPDIIAGQQIGTDNALINKADIATPMLIIDVIPEIDKDYSSLVEAMHILTDEDPKIDLEWLKDERKLHIKIIGLIQLEVLKATLLSRFYLNVKFGKPTVIYKETPSRSFIAYEAYTMPKPCWAVVRFKVEPLERGSGVQYNSEAGVNEIAIRYQQEVERTIPNALKQGILGWEVTDIKITLIGDEDHNVHSRAGDFAVATHMALMKGFNDNGMKLLEPILNYTIRAKEEKLGNIVSSLSHMRAEIGVPEIIDDQFVLKGTVPVATSLELPTKIAALTGGKGSYSSSFNSYKECDIELGETTDYRGINPLDRAKYILKARKALQ